MTLGGNLLCKVWGTDILSAIFSTFNDHSSSIMIINFDDVN